jgi:hypothetical protein
VFLAAVHGIFPRIFNTTIEGNQSSLGALVFPTGKISMQAAIDRVMHTYGMLVDLTLEDERKAREKVSKFLAASTIEDENKLAVEGLKYLRSEPQF